MLQLKINRALEALLLRRANPNIAENWNGGPLHWAAHNGNKTAVQLLLDAGADAAIKNKNDKTAADCATVKGHDDLSVYLEHAENSWKRKERNPNEIVNRNLPTQDYGITSIFNFKSMTVTKIIKDFATLKNSHETVHFSHPAAEKDKIITASAEFEKQGGKIDTTKFRRALHTITPQDYMPRYRHKINRRTPPGSQ